LFITVKEISGCPFFFKIRLQGQNVVAKTSLTVAVLALAPWTLQQLVETTLLVVILPKEAKPTFGHFAQGAKAIAEVTSSLTALQLPKLSLMLVCLLMNATLITMFIDLWFSYSYVHIKWCHSGVRQPGQK
jgi:hypothetical protein